jgi:hypothetical protein
MLLLLGAAVLLVLQAASIALLLVERQLLLHTVADLHLLTLRVQAIEHATPYR